MCAGELLTETATYFCSFHFCYACFTAMNGKEISLCSKVMQLVCTNAMHFGVVVVAPWFVWLSAVVICGDKLVPCIETPFTVKHRDCIHAPCQKMSHFFVYMQSVHAAQFRCLWQASFTAFTLEPQVGQFLALYMLFLTC